MTLLWSHQNRIAEALIATYPETDRTALSLQKLEEMIVALPGFSDQTEAPTESHLNHILWTWMRLADDGGKISCGRAD